MTYNKPSKTFCILPWIHLSTRPSGHMRVCCTANASGSGPLNSEMLGGEIGLLKENDGLPSNLGHHSLSESWNNYYMRSIRLKMLSGEVPDSCIKCFKEEAAGHESKRKWETEYWSHRIDIPTLIDETKSDGSVPPKVYYIDLRMGTKCNLKCIMCSPHDSSMWESDWRKIYPKIKNRNLKQLFGWSDGTRIDGGSYQWHQNNPSFWNELYEQIPHMKQLYFAGGEPTIIKEHYTLLEEVVNRGYAKDIEVRYNSNGLVIPDKLLDLWKEFKLVRFHFSIDSIERMNDYIRWPPNWEIVKKQLRKLDDTEKKFEITIACAVQALNVYYIPDLIKWKLSQNFKKINPQNLGAGLVNFHLVYLPAFLNVKILPEWFKIKVKEKHDEFYKWLFKNYRNDDDFINSSYGIKRLKGIVSFMFSEDWSVRMPEFREYISLVDGVRGTNFRETFPEMEELLDE